ncbi:hypothetical protein [Mechercharimyces sp. CAU 1602]|uniref:hypothetical protein n=1 Tax=Mechercharimyces sp. CAU 1602 TaxID=2973933 RepID=UPI0021636B9E|nr:hypothetical protein [Mechercharimyces sp. CAU 1602]MCS1350880.1 hypothetical protein [Mechercharimyces sp. CAU 1602]
MESTLRERIKYILSCYLNGDPVSIDSKTFCEQYHLIYDLNGPDDSVSSEEHLFYMELSDTSSRFNPSSQERDKYPGVYSDEVEVYEKSRLIWNLINS